MKQNIIIIGGGAAGFFAAINAAEKSKESTITILEKSTKLLTKVKVSGGGRCNVTHACEYNSELVKYYPRGEKTLRDAFDTFSVKDIFDWFDKRGVHLKTEDDVYHPSNRSPYAGIAAQINVDRIATATLVPVERPRANEKREDHQNKGDISCPVSD